MHSTYSTPCGNCTNACAIGTMKDIVASLSSGTTMDKSPPIDAQLRQQSPYPFPTHSPTKTEEPTISPCQAHIWGKEAIFTDRRQFPALNKVGKNFTQGLCAVFMYLAQSVNGGLLPVLSSPASLQVNPTEKTMELCKQFLDYMATQEDAKLIYHASNMVLAIHSNASHLSKPKSCSCAGGHIIIAGKDIIAFNNGTVLNMLQMI
jgi:hypothetical protein